MLHFLVLAVLSAHAGGAQKRAEAMQARAFAASDQAIVAAMNTERQTCEEGGPRGPNGWAALVKSLVDNGAYGRGSLADADLDALVAYLKAAPDHTPALGDALGNAAAALRAAGRTDDADALATMGLDAGPTATALEAWIAGHPGDAEIPSRCQTTLDAAGSDIARYDTLSVCNAAIGPEWTDQTSFEQERARRAHSQAAQDQKREAESEALFQQVAADAAARDAAAAAARASARAPAPSSAPAGPVLVSATVSCPNKVRLFQGSAPTSGGTTGWQSSNSVFNRSVPVGYVLCLCDERDQKQSCWTASGTTARLEITCTGFLTR